MGFLHQTAVLLRKNVILLRRNWKSTLFQMFIPAIVVAFLLVLDVSVRNSVGEAAQDIPIQRGTTDIGNIPRCRVADDDDHCYTFVHNLVPGHEEMINTLMTYVMNRESIPAAEVLGIPGTAVDVNKYLFDNVNISQGAYVFDFEFYPTALNVTVQVNETIYANLCPPNQNNWWRCPDFSRDIVIPMQRALDEALVSYQSGGSPTLTFRHMPYPHPVVARANIVGNFAALFLLFAAIMPLLIQLQQVMQEKEAKLKYAVGLIGVSHLAYWISWFVVHSALAIVGIFLMIATGAIGGMDFFLKNDFGIYFFTFLFFHLSNVATAYLMSTFFKTVKSSRMLALAYLFLFGLFSGFGALVYSDGVEDTVSDGWRTGLAFLPPVVFNKALTDMQGATSTTGSAGIRWGERGNFTELYPFTTVWGWMVLDTVLFLLLGWYLDQVIPDAFGVSRRAWFPFTKEYWGMKGAASTPHVAMDGLPGEDSDVAKERARVAQDDFPEGAPVVKLRNLRKVFSPLLPVGGRPSFTAVNDVNIAIPDNSLFCLLGPNGAGKTTTINMLTGGVAATSGIATIDGHDVFSEMETIRPNLGVCPQFDILWDELTGAENIEIFAALKGLAAEQLSKEVNDRLVDVELEEAGEQKAGGYSGGMRRRLSVAMALTCNPHIVFLDEPTTGMDPVTRRKVWDIIERAKVGRAVILTTHSMEEADVLSDRIAIMTNGNIRCLGTSVHLKRKFGSGYRVVVIASTEHLPTVQNEVTSEFLDSTELLHATPVSFTLRVLPGHTDVLPKLFSSLEGRELVKDFQISLTTLEDVFLRVAEEAGGEEFAEENKIAVDAGVEGDFERSDPQLATVGSATSRSSIPSGPTPYWIQGQAVIAKTFHLQKRKRISNVCQMLIPSLIILILVLLQIFAVGDSANQTFPAQPAPQSFPVVGLINQSMPYLYTGPGGDLDIPTPIQEFASMEDMQKHIYDQWYQSLEINGALSYATVDPAAMALDATVLFNRTRNSGFASAFSFESVAASMSLLSEAFSMAVNSSAVPTITMHSEFPRREYTEKFDIVTLGSAIFFPLILFFQFPVYIGSIMHDKERKLIEIMKMMGMSMSVYWAVNWMFDMALYVCVLIILFIFGYSFQFTFFTASSFLVIFILFLLWGFAMIGLAFVFTAFFARELPASIASYVLVFLAWTIAGVLVQTVGDDDAMALFITSLFPYFAFSRGVGYIATSVRTGGIQLSDLSQPDVYMMNVYGYLIVESFILYFLTWYLDNVFPAGFGVKKSPWFCLMPSYWRGKVEGPAQEEELGLLSHKSSSLPANEDEDVTAERLRVSDPKYRGDYAIRLAELRKMYSGGVLAVRDQTFGVLKGECFGLLGHNGAGKTTIASMLSGLIVPTSGDAYVHDLPISTEMDTIHSILGVCPQHDLLWVQMTASEHLHFYGRLRGFTGAALKNAVASTLNELNLSYVANKKAGEFSGGMKRRLSIGMAIIGGPRVIFLDEPTTGLDPKNRRDIWNVISRTCANDSAVVLTTHSMEEAEALCDRIGIMAAGTMRCVGTSSHLKRKFAAGYSILLQIEPEHVKDAQRAVDFVKQLLPAAQHLPQSLGPSQHFHVAQGECDLARFFSEMEASKAEFHIADWVISQTTLEDVFLEITRTAEHGTGDVASVRTKHTSLRLTEDSDGAGVAADTKV